MLILALLAAAQSVPQPAPVKTFGDWSVACDNVRSCEMVSLIPEGDAGGDEAEGFEAGFAVSRDAGPAAMPVLDVTASGPLGGAAELRIDGKTVARASASSDTAAFRGADAARIAAAMAGGRRIELFDGQGRLAARASLTGASAALRYIDAGQGRAGTVTAIVAGGAGPATAVPAAPPVPQVRALAPPSTTATAPASLLAGLAKQARCDENYGEGMDPPPSEVHALGGGKLLALIPCGNGAYNYMTVAFVIDGGRGSPARFDAAPGGTPEEGPATLVNAGWDPAKGILASYAKGRGLGDCGNSEAYVWDGAMFRLIEAREMAECRGSVNWLRTWVAEPAAR
jgi:hypothetical protein